MIARPTKSLETELKLELTEAGMAAFLASGFLAETPTFVAQHAIYFDTPDHTLRSHGLSLRIRQEGQKRVQTLKSATSSAGLFTRTEWERPAADGCPILDHISPLANVIGSREFEIGPIFTIDNERRQWNRSGIEISLDCGRIKAADRQTPFIEIELEHKGGDAASIFALARQIDAVAPVHIGVLSKPDRGYRLLDAASGAIKSRRVILDKSMTAARASQTIGIACLHHYRLNVPSVLHNRDPAALHQARVAIRRLRSALTIQKNLFSDNLAPALNSELRWLAAELGNARDIDVLLKRRDLGLDKARLVKARASAYDQVEAALQSDRARALAIDLVEWLSIGGWLLDPRNKAAKDIPVREAAASTLQKLHRKVKRKGRDLENLDDERRHELRKAGKKLRYATEFFAAIYEGKHARRKYKRFLSTLEDLQDSLGDLNDLSATSEILRRIGMVSKACGEQGAKSDLKSDLLRRAAKHQKQLMETKPFWK